MYHCHTRYYVPKWLRWLNSDNVEYLNIDDFEGINLFVYCGNNPIAADPDGTFAIALAIGIGIGIVALISLAAMASQSSRYNNFYIENPFEDIEDFIDEKNKQIEDFIFSSIAKTVNNLFSKPKKSDNNIIQGCINNGINSVTSENGSEFLDNFSTLNSSLFLIKKDFDPDPFKRKGQKKQNREVKTKARKRGYFQPRYRRGRKPPKSHRPGKDYQKIFALLLISWLLKRH